ncbi:MAG TPA: NifB/NifX family molybdenum-iron cluster-binding protein [Spirochaetales bacterium]|nr:NifB/NifX family molybdenum-iron cluster-binding protein [Spirochaetales bacterium]
MIIAIPTDDKKTVSSVFGRAEFFALYKDGQSEPEFVSGTEGAEHGAGTGAVSMLVSKGVTRVVAPQLGPKAADSLKVASVEVRIAAAGTELAQALKS